MSFETVKCKLCGNTTAVRPTCKTCGRKSCRCSLRGDQCVACVTWDTSDHELANNILAFLDSNPFSTGREIACGIHRDFATVDSFLYGHLAARVVRNNCDEWYLTSEVSIQSSTAKPPNAALPSPTNTTIPPSTQSYSKVSHQPIQTTSVELSRPEPLPPVPSWRHASASHIDRRATIQKRIKSIYQSLCEPKFVKSASGIDGSFEAIEQLKTAIQVIKGELEKVPAISVALLGPSRHGKSTLLNALAGCTMLPTSDVKPCTASVVSLKCEEEWGFRIRFIKKERLERERARAVQDALDYLKRSSKKMMGDEQPDDPRYLHSTLERFIRLFDLDSNLPPDQLIRAVHTAEIPDSVQRLLGQSATPKSKDVVQMEQTVEKYLSTKDIYWTIVDDCEISGPFQNWHPNLRLVDVPGTNDTDPQRTAITNKLRETAKAVAICTSDSNLGNDIQSWLRNSSVLGDFLEATEQSRQHLFIIKTKLDAVHPDIDESRIDPNDEDSEERLFREALERHKQQQTESYREMFRRIASPLLPVGMSPEQQETRNEMLKRIDGIKVHFVSAPAYEAFEGRFKGLARQKRTFIEHFNGDKKATGIPGLRDFANKMAETYLADFYFDDLERQIEMEVDRLVRFFRQQWTTIEAQVSGGSEAIAELVDEIDQKIIPWLESSVAEGIQSFQSQATKSSQEILGQLRQTEESIEALLTERQTKWRQYYWNSIKAACRKAGIHTTCNGQFMDFNQDVCSIFVDNLILSWTTYRENCIRSSTQTISDGVAAELQIKLDNAASQTDVPAATDAIDAIVTNLSTIARSKLDELRREVDAAIQELESIRKPAYEAIQSQMRSTYQVVERENGTGCQERMRAKLCSGAESNVQSMWAKVNGMISGAVGGLESQTVASMKQYGTSASAELRKSVSQLREIGKTSQREVMLQQLEHIREAVVLLWTSLSAVGEIVVETQKFDVAAKVPNLVAPTKSHGTVPSLGAGETEDHARLTGPTDQSNAERVYDVQLEFESEIAVESDADREGQDQANVAEVVINTHTSDTPHSFTSPHSLNELCETTTYLVQKDRAGRSAPADNVVVCLLETLIDHHGKMTLAALSEQISIPAFRLRGMLPSVQRILNLDGQQILKIERTSDTIELDESLMRQEFSL